MMTKREKMDLANIIEGTEVNIFDNITKTFSKEKVIKVNDCSFITESGISFSPSKFYSDGGMTFKADKKYIELYK